MPLPRMQAHQLRSHSHKPVLPRGFVGAPAERAALVYANETPFLIFLLLLVTVLFAAGLHEHRTPTR
jgi:hypothetical protein